MLTPGQAGDAPAFTEVMAGLRVPRPIGRPRTTPDVVLADKAYSSRAIRRHLRRRGIRAVIPQPSDQVANRKRLGSHGGRPPAFDHEEAYKQRNTVERCINKLKQWPRPGHAIRQDRHRLPGRTPPRGTVALAEARAWRERPSAGALSDDEGQLGERVSEAGMSGASVPRS